MDSEDMRPVSRHSDRSKDKPKRIVKDVSVAFLGLRSCIVSNVVILVNSNVLLDCEFSLLPKLMCYVEQFTVYKSGSGKCLDWQNVYPASIPLMAHNNHPVSGIMQSVCVTK